MDLPLSAPLDEARPVRAGEELDAERLAAWLRGRWPELRDELAITQFPGGHSNLTYLVQAGPRELVLRRPPFGNLVKGAHDMGREYRVLAALQGVYAAAPRPVLFCDDESLLGAPFYMMERRRGVVLRGTLPPGITLDPPTARRLAKAFVANLAALHAIDWRAAGLGELARPEGYARRQVEGWAKRWQDARTQDVPEVERVIAWLRERVPAESGATLVHNDYKYDNLVLDPADLGRIVAVLDWEMCTIGDPLMDLGTSLAYWTEAGDADRAAMPVGLGAGPTTLPGSPTRRELAQSYAAATGRDVSGMPFYYCFGLFKLVVILQQIYARFVRGATRDARFARLDAPVALLGRLAHEAARSGRY